MTRRRDWTLVDGDPTPGRPEGIRRKGDVFVRIATTAQEAERDLRSIKERDMCEAWEGELATSFSDSIESEFLGALGKLDKSFHKAGHALHDYSSLLSELQEQAARELDRAIDADRRESELERSARAIRDQMTDSRRTLDQLDEAIRRLNAEYYSQLATRAPDDQSYDRRYQDWSRRLSVARAQRDEAESRAARASSRLREVDDATQSARSQLRRSRDQVAELKRRREAAERKAAGRLDEASKLGIRNKNLWEKAWDKYGNLEFLDNALGVISSVLAIAALICAVIPVIQVAAPILFGLSVAAGALKVLVGVVRAANGDKSWGAVGIDVGLVVLDVFTAGLGGKAARAGVAGVRAAGKSTPAALRGARTLADVGVPFTKKFFVGGLVKSIGKVTRAGSAIKAHRALARVPVTAASKASRKLWSLDRYLMSKGIRWDPTKSRAVRVDELLRGVRDEVWKRGPFGDVAPSAQDLRDPKGYLDRLNDRIDRLVPTPPAVRRAPVCGPLQPASGGGGSW